MSYQVLEVDDFCRHDESAIADIRTEVFIEEQGFSQEEENSDTDEPQPRRQYLATGRITPSGRIGRVCVRKSHRGRGLGTLVMKTLISFARRRQYSEICLGAQVSAQAFYRKLEFVPFGEIFLEGGLDHQMMKMKL